jgi:hypothetical protein
MKMAGTLMMEAVNTYETSVNVYQTTRLNNPEDSHLHYSVFLEQVDRPLPLSPY